jgi:hypothetical protein
MLIWKQEGIIKTVFAQSEVIMKKSALSLMAVVFFLAPAAFVYAIHMELPSETSVAFPGPDAGRLYEYITRYKPYHEWHLWPGKGRFYKGTEPHGALLTTYVNKDAYFSIKGKEGKMADNSIIVKENYTPQKELAALTVILKVKGYNPAAGDWFWAKYSPGGKVLSSGKVDSCIGCHGTHKDNDYIMTQKLGK